MGPRRMRDYDQSTSLEERMEKRDAAAAAAEKQQAREVHPEEQVVGAHATNVYHFEECDLVKDVSRKDRVLFVSPFDALDGGFRPCARCRPGP